jgi:hypothetical protein
MKNQNKSKRKEDSKISAHDDKAQILKEILQLDDTEIFMNEYNILKESLEGIKNPSMKNLIYSNFLFNKLEEVEKQIKLGEVLIQGDCPFNLKLDSILKTKSTILDIIKGLNLPRQQEDHPPEEIVYRLKIFYSEGSDNPQQISLKLQRGSNYSIFLRELKKTLDIYEFAKFKIILMLSDSENKVLDNLDDLNTSEEINLKIVPVTH